MDLRFHTGHFFLAIKDEFVVKAERIDVAPDGFILDGGDLKIAASDLTHSWKISPTQILPLSLLNERTRIGGAILDMELCMKRFHAETKQDAFVLSDSPVIFGAASLALTVISDRTSDDVDFAISSDFLRWRREKWSSLGITQTETLPFSIFAYCGNWRSRATVVSGLEGTTFRLMHPVDTVMQKLLRIKSDECKFEHKDKRDIELVMETLSPSHDMLVALLTENPLRYQEPVVEPGRRGREALAQHSSMKENTIWFLERFLPGLTYDEICKRALNQIVAPIDSMPALSLHQTLPELAKIIEADRADL